MRFGRRASHRTVSVALAAATVILVLSGCRAQHEADRLAEAVEDLPGIEAVGVEYEESSLKTYPSATTSVTTVDDIESEQLATVLQTWTDAANTETHLAKAIRITVGDRECDLTVDFGAPRDRLDATASFLIALCDEFPAARISIEHRWYGRSVFLNTRGADDPNADPELLEHLRGLPGAVLPDDVWRVSSGGTQPAQRYDWP